jgi:hypothetical protein
MGRGNPQAKLEKFKKKRKTQRVQPVLASSPARRPIAVKRAQPRAAPRPNPALRRVRGWLEDTRLALESPHANTLERLGKRGKLTDAFGYVALSAVLTGVLALRAGALASLFLAVLIVAAFAVFVYSAHWSALRQGGTGKLEGLAYASALYWAILAPFTALVPFVFGAAWIPAAVLIQIFASVAYMLHVLNGTLWVNYTQQWNALSTAIAAASVGVLLLSFALLPPLLRH